MAEAGFRKPSNGVVMDMKGNMITQFFEVKTAATMYPGRLVMRDTTDDGVKVCTNNKSATGWLGYEYTPGSYKPTDRTTIYSAGDRAAVHSGGGFLVRAYLVDNGQAITKGEHLTNIDTSGCLVKQGYGGTSLDSSDSVAIAMESVTATAGAGAAAIWVQSLI